MLGFSPILLFTGRSSGFGNRSSRITSRGEYGTSPFLRINQDGQLVGKHLDYFGSTDSLRLGMHLPRRFKEEQSLPEVKETELGVDFCLTWSTDPRWKQHSQKKIVRNFHFPGQSLCRMIQQEGQLQQQQQPRLTLTLIWSGWSMKERRLQLRRNLSRGDPLTSLRLSTVTLAKPR